MLLLQTSPRFLSLYSLQRYQHSQLTITLARSLATSDTAGSATRTFLPIISAPFAQRTGESQLTFLQAYHVLPSAQHPLADVQYPNWLLGSLPSASWAWFEVKCSSWLKHC
jgi:hypothetical protein